MTSCYSWTIGSMVYEGLCSHNPLVEEVPGDFGLTAEQLEELDKKRRERIRELHPVLRPCSRNVETGKVFHHDAHISLLQANDEFITQFSGQVRIFPKSLPKAAETELPRKINNRCKYLADI